MLTPKMKKTLATLVAFLAFACAAFAAERTLPTPPASSFPDTESSLNVPLPDWPTLGRRITLSLAASFTPSNCVQIAFGQDTDADGDLAPEETHLVLGVDCGAPFIREELGKWGSGVLAVSEQDYKRECPRDGCILAWVRRSFKRTKPFLTNPAR